MKQHLFTILFITGFSGLVLCRNYFLIEQGKTWNDSQAYCKATYTGLAIVQNNDDLVQIQNEIQSKQFNSSAWIGLYNDINSWRWSLGNQPLGKFQQWMWGIPKNSLGVNECGQISPWGWIDWLCDTVYPFLCYDETKTGNQRYILISKGMAWTNAQTYCRLHYTDLASSRNTSEAYSIMRVVGKWSWFGLFRDGWKWIDKTAFSTITWTPGQPDNALNDENCGYLNNSQAADALCTDRMPFICYSDQIIEKQIIKIKVQSSQDPNDPSLSLAILEQIKQKLKNHGLNITVKFREQPTGDFFNNGKQKYNKIN